MAKHYEYLNLEQLLKSAKDFDPNQFIILHFDPQAYHFFIIPDGVMPFFLPRTAVKIGKCQACYVRHELEKFISYAVSKLTEEPKPHL